METPNSPKSSRKKFSNFVVSIPTLACTPPKFRIPQFGSWHSDNALAGAAPPLQSGHQTRRNFKSPARLRLSITKHEMFGKATYPGCFENEKATNPNPGLKYRGGNRAESSFPERPPPKVPNLNSIVLPPSSCFNSTSESKQTVTGDIPISSYPLQSQINPSRVLRFLVKPLCT